MCARMWWAYCRSQQAAVGIAVESVLAPAVAPVEAPLPRENAVMVLGATGRLGRRVVKQVGGPARFAAGMAASCARRAN